MGLSEAILCLDESFTGLPSHKETHSRESFKYCTVDTGWEREKKEDWWKNTEFSNSILISVIAIVALSAPSNHPSLVNAYSATKP